MLTPQQVAHFDAFGFLFLRQVFSAGEIAEVVGAAEAIWRENRERREFVGDYQTLAPFIERDPVLGRLAIDDRIYQPMEQLLGPGFFFAGSEGNTGIPRNGEAHHWHSDRSGEFPPDYLRIKIMLYLLPMTARNGPLRVIPGSHKLPFFKDLDPLNPQRPDTCRDAFGLNGAELPAYQVETTPGDVVFFNQYLYHGVYGGPESGSRRYIAMKFAHKPTEERHIASLRRHTSFLFDGDIQVPPGDHPRLRTLRDNALEVRRQWTPTVTQ